MCKGTALSAHSHTYNGPYRTREFIKRAQWYKPLSTFAYIHWR